MGICAVCGNEYEHCMTVAQNGKEYEFDCFECAIEQMAPRCQRCHTRVIGHGVQDGETIYCSAHCAQQTGVAAIQDRA